MGTVVWTGLTIWIEHGQYDVSLHVDVFEPLRFFATAERSTVVLGGLVVIWGCVYACECLYVVVVYLSMSMIGISRCDVFGCWLFGFLQGEHELLPEVWLCVCCGCCHGAE